jgi:hypothetical protein
VSPTCSVCHGALRGPDRLGVEHRDGPVRAHADARTFTVCDDHAAGGRAARDAVLAAVDDRLTFAQRQRRTLHCGACSATLDLPMRATTRSLTVEPPDGAPFTLTLALPLVRCGGCGVDNVPTELAGPVRRCALAAAGATAGAHGRPGTHGARERLSRQLRRLRLLRRLRRPDGPRSPGSASPP